jgi:hypothetical protein
MSDFIDDGDLAKFPSGSVWLICSKCGAAKPVIAADYDEIVRIRHSNRCQCGARGAKQTHISIVRTGNDFA